MIAKLNYYYKMLFFQSCARKSEKYNNIKELASGAYWLISALEGINIISIMLLTSWMFEREINKIALLIFFPFPLILNYFYFMKNDKYKKILKNLSHENLEKSNLKSYGLVLGYFILTILLFLIAGRLYQK